MPSEKEINNQLFDQLSIIERIEDVVKGGDLDAVKKALKKEKAQINRKLYQKPPLTEDK